VRWELETVLTEIPLDRIMLLFPLSDWIKKEERYLSFRQFWEQSRVELRPVLNEALVVIFPRGQPPQYIGNDFDVKRFSFRRTFEAALTRAMEDAVFIFLQQEWAQRPKTPEKH